MQPILLRVAISYLVVTIIIGAILYALVPGLLWIYVVIAIIGAWGVYSAFRDMMREAAAKSLFDGGLRYRYAEAERAQAAAAEVSQEPWMADSVVDLQDASRRRAIAGSIMGSPDDLVPNPYFVLPLPKLVFWDFATEVEVREAVRWADSPTPPVRWQNPPLRGWLNAMGWTDPEAYARIGLFFWHTDEPIPSAQAASIESDLRRQGLIYDVPRPASLD